MKNRFWMVAAVVLLVAACGNKDGQGDASPTRSQIKAAVQDSAKPINTQGGGTSNLGVVSISVQPTSPNAAQAITADARVSPGSGAYYQWYLNDQKLTGEIGRTLNPGKYKKGDKVSVEVVAKVSANQQSVPKRKDIVIGNQLPAITSSPGASGLNGYQVTSSDPDGETLKYKLENAPSNMTISAAGVISWPPPYDSHAGKKFEVRIIAEDADGAQAIQVVPINVPQGS